MDKSPRILAFAGSARKGSFNRKLLAIAADEARAGGAEVSVADLNDYTMPLYNGDLEEAQGIPEAVLKFAGQIRGHDALLVASPEYNALITPLLKNTIDWCSRLDENPFEGRVAAVISASPGPYGAVRSAQAARQLLMKLGCLVIPGQMSLSNAGEAFDENGRFKNPRHLKSIQSVAAELVRTTAKFVS